MLMVVAVVVVAGAVALLAAGNPFDEEGSDAEACNGSALLCDRPLNRVAFAATHNSMSAADQKGWTFTQQEKGVPDQLDAGIRGLLIDMYYGVQTRRGVQNVPLGKVDERLRPGALGRDVYLCHALCGFGATRATDALRDVRDFLAAHSREVVVISIEDYVRPRDVARLFEESGLARYVWRRALGRERFPTLRAMVDQDRRVVVMMEHRAGHVRWLHPQFDLVQETPYTFRSPREVAAESSCRSNRGSPDNPLFLLNNWVDTSPVPQPRNAAEVNSHDALLRRARTCGRLRERLPNLVAVDFFEQGDVVGVVRELNR
jgi:hypothetical protein